MRITIRPRLMTAQKNGGAHSRWTYYFWSNFGVLTCSLLVAKWGGMSLGLVTISMVSAVLVANSTVWWSLRRLTGSSVRPSSPAASGSRNRMKPKTLVWIGILLCCLGILQLTNFLGSSAGAVTVPDAFFGFFLFSLADLS